MKLFLDDVRSAPDGWELCKTSSDVITRLDMSNNGIKGREEVTDVSLDHDLGPINEDGYDILIYIEEQVHTNPDFKLPKLYVHSSNPAAKERMQRAIISIYEAWEEKHG